VARLLRGRMPWPLPLALPNRVRPADRRVHVLCVCQSASTHAHTETHTGYDLRPFAALFSSPAAICFPSLVNCSACSLRSRPTLPAQSGELNTRSGFTTTPPSLDEWHLLWSTAARPRRAVRVAGRDESRWALLLLSHVFPRGTSPRVQGRHQMSCSPCFCYAQCLNAYINLTPAWPPRQRHLFLAN
jgi:hypothetical protein